MNPVWDILWKLRIPSKINFFSWKALHGTIPGMSILADRHIPVSPQCPVCFEGPEDILHLMFSCSRAKDIWRSLGILPYIESTISLNRSGSVVLEEILRDLIQVQNGIIKTDLKELILVGAWYIWWQRREFVKGESVSPPRQSAFSIQALKSNYCAAERKSEPKEVNWCKPPMNSYKLNVDACFFTNGT
jgi:hypothetical protein